MLAPKPDSVGVFILRFFLGLARYSHHHSESCDGQKLHYLHKIVVSGLKKAGWAVPTRQKIYPIY
jgi:hypothetical protein